VLDDIFLKRIFYDLPRLAIFNIDEIFRDLPMAGGIHKEATVYRGLAGIHNSYVVQKRRCLALSGLCFRFFVRLRRFYGS
jgi:hypothetical protein